VSIRTLQVTEDSLESASRVAVGTAEIIGRTDSGAIWSRAISATVSGFSNLILPCFPPFRIMRAKAK
jgi:hypothetical protein